MRITSIDANTGGQSADRLDRILAEAKKQTDALLEDVDLTAEALAKDPSPSHKERDAAVYSIFGEFRKLSVQHLTFEHTHAENGVVATQKPAAGFQNSL